MELKIGQKVRIPAYLPDGTATPTDDVEAKILGFSAGGNVVYVRLPTYPKPSNAEFLTSDVIDWNKQA